MGAKTVRGFIRGVIWGGVLATGGLVTLSQLAPTGPNLPASPGDLVDAAGSAALPEAAGSLTPVVPAAPQEQAVAETPGDVVASSIPDTERTTPELATPDQTAAPQPPAVTDKAPPAIASEPAADAPKAPAPGGETLPGVAQPLAPAAPFEGDKVAAAPLPPSEPPARPQTEGPEMAGGADAAPAPARIIRPEEGTEPAGLPGRPVPSMPGAPLAEAAPQTAEPPPPPPIPPRDEALLQPAPEVAAGADSGQGAAEPVAPVPSAEPATTVVTGRLPRIGDPEPPPEVAPDAVPAEGAGITDESYDAALDESLPPIRRFARPFDNPGQKPLFSILLEDRGDEVDRAELAALSLPLTIVIDPLSEGAAERAAVWRSAGQEVVLALSGLPAGATPADVEQTLQALADRLPEAVAVIDPDGKVFQTDRLLASQIVAILAQQGRGLVSFDQGLNAADQVARREGVGSATIFRRIDIDNATGPEVKRYLDRAVFRAAQEGEVAVIGTLTPQIVAGLMEWTVEGRAATVALAPVTALMAR